MIFDPNLISYAKTDLEKKYFNAVLKHGSQTDAAKAVNVTINAFNKAIKRLRVRAAENCDSPEHNLVNKGAPGFGLQGYSMYHPATPDNPDVSKATIALPFFLTASKIGMSSVTMASMRPLSSSSSSSGKPL